MLDKSKFHMIANDNNEICLTFQWLISFNVILIVLNLLDPEWFAALNGLTSLDNYLI